ncbi:MAG: hypothetical protein WED05_00585 [Candidatus Atabeyarchaeum deiterrae]
MVELVELLTNVLLLLAGLFVGALLTYEFSIRQEKRQKENRKLGVASILHIDILSRLIAIWDLRDIFEELEKTLTLTSEQMQGKIIETIESYKSAFSRDTFMAFLPELPLLPEDTIVSTLTFYRNSEIRLQLIWEHLETRDGTNLRNAADLCDKVYNQGEGAIASLIAVEQRIGIGEARPLANKEVEAIRKRKKGRV